MHIFKTTMYFPSSWTKRNNLFSLLVSRIGTMNVHRMIVKEHVSISCLPMVLFNIQLNKYSFLFLYVHGNLIKIFLQILCKTSVENWTIFFMNNIHPSSVKPPRQFYER